MMVNNSGSGNVPNHTIDYYTNHSAPEEKGFSNTELFSICIYSVILFMGVLGNGLVIFVTGYKMKTTVNSIWFLNLAIADFLYILILIPYIVVTFNKMVWPFDNFMCKFTSLMSMQNMFASVFFLTVISLDRCLCTWLVVWAQNKRTLVKARIICVFVWILSICCSIPFAIIRSVQEHHGVKNCIYSRPTNVIMSLFTYRFMLGFLIPFFVILSSYIAISLRIKRLQIGKRLRPFQVIISVILAFFICWFPYHIQRLLNTSAVMYNWSYSVKEQIKSAEPYVLCLIYLNSCLNPILYVFMCDEYKKKLKKSLLVVLEVALTEDHLDIQTSQSHREP